MSSPSSTSSSNPPAAKKPRQADGRGLSVSHKLVECPVCLEIPRGNIVQCQKGHHLCQACYNRMRFGHQRADRVLCPVGKCQYDKVPRRSLLAEQIVDESGYIFPCRNADNGCIATTKKSNIAQHEAKCPFRPIDCLVRRCAYRGVTRRNLGHHYNSCHLNWIASPSRNVNIVEEHGVRSNAAGIDQSYFKTTVAVDEDMLSIYSSYIFKSKCVILVAKANLEDPRYNGLECQMEVSIPKKGTYQYQGPMYDLEDKPVPAQDGVRGLYMPMELIRNRRVYNRNEELCCASFPLTIKLVKRI